ncbi:RNA polymerase sigma factor [Sedimentisphaera salicampi]|uniref:RNA polymerase sigma factor RpoE n=1 Tax=Sedimentisphaera salicampi TaxID=1941349 RepID=A0A1W6LJB4_9BACT|nr:sigma-70 family RNA polymerase sigma factor [Sedimentisphaera salicampi]ARN55824.1 RNA polymerase sigma factor RpoE [Sedimentisphaera salicampi]OXU16017.1 RNA polymerase sigma factor RpoE [Sedimentisphaera salicampi]
MDKSFVRMFQKVDKIIYRYIAFHVSDKNDAEDIMQEVCLVMWKKYKPFTDSEQFKAWGLTIARLQILRYYNLQKRHCKVNSHDPELLEAFRSRSGRFSQRQKSEIEEMLDKQLQLLTKEEKAFLSERYEDRLTLKSLAEIHSTSIRCVHYKLQKIHRKLRRKLNIELRREDVAV